LWSLISKIFVRVEVCPATNDSPNNRP
jgi:hypothetical protein